MTVSPLAVDDAATTTDGAPVEVDVQANDIGDAGAPTIVTPPTNGTAVIGSIIYTPNPGFVGTDRVTYQICSPNDLSLCDAAVLTITVTAAAPTPVPTATPPPTDVSPLGPLATMPGGVRLSRHLRDPRARRDRSRRRGVPPPTTPGPRTESVSRWLATRWATAILRKVRVSRFITVRRSTTARPSTTIC